MGAIRALGIVAGFEVSLDGNSCDRSCDRENQGLS